MKTIALILFIITYILMIALPKKRVYVALISAAIFLILGILPWSKVMETINWNVLMMIAGTMIVVDFFIDSKMPNLLADILLDKSKNVMWVTIYMSLFAGVISAFIDNVATVLMVAPVALVLCKKLKISPVPMVIAIAVSSNLQGAATLVGDTTSIMLGAYAHMDFLDFFWMNGRPGIFFAVELGAAATIPVMMYLFRKDKQPVEAKEKTVVKDYVPTILLVSVVVCLIGASFIPGKPEIANGLICMTIALVSIIYNFWQTNSFERSLKALKSLDFTTLLLLTGLFIIIGGITEVGVIEDISKIFVKIGGDNLFLLYTLVVWLSVFLSAFIDNIPYVATMLPVLTSVASIMGIQPYVLYFGLLSGATLGGNITPIGASANITGIGMLRKHGYEVSFKDFARIGLPFTLSAVIVSYVFVWLVWA